LAIVHVDAVNAIFRKRAIIAEMRLGVLLQILRHSDNGRACQTSGRSGREGWIVIEKHLHRLKRPERSQCSRPRNPSLLIHPLPNAGPCAALQPPGLLSCFCFFFFAFSCFLDAACYRRSAALILEQKQQTKGEIKRSQPFLTSCR
jgi:hypothetical protein